MIFPAHFFQNHLKNTNMFPNKVTQYTIGVR